MERAAIAGLPVLVFVVAYIVFVIFAAHRQHELSQQHEKDDIEKDARVMCKLLGDMIPKLGMRDADVQTEMQEVYDALCTSYLNTE